MLSLLEHVVLVLFVPHLARESRTAYIAVACGLATACNVPEVLPVAIVVLFTHDTGVHDVVIEWALTSVVCVDSGHHSGA